MTQKKFVELMSPFGCDTQGAKNLYDALETGQKAAFKFKCLFFEGLVIIVVFGYCNSKIKCSFALYDLDGIKCGDGDFESIAKKLEEVIERNKPCISFMSSIERMEE